MHQKIKSIRPFIGAKDFELSKSFYRDLGFQEIIVSPVMCLLIKDQIGFYLQHAYVKDWIDNSMIFLEVDDVDIYYEELLALGLPAKFDGAKLTPVHKYDWGKECFLHDPSGVLWHFGQFNK